MPKVNKPKSTDIQEQLAQKLQVLRQQKGVSQAEIANYIELSVGAYQNYENGRREANYETLCKFANFFNVSTDYLLGRTTVKQTATEQPDPFEVLGFKKTVDDDEFVRLYNTLPDFAKQIFVDTMLKLAQATTNNLQKKSTRPTQPVESPPKQRHVQRLGDIEDELEQERQAKAKDVI